MSDEILTMADLTSQLDSPDDELKRVESFDDETDDGKSLMETVELINKHPELQGFGLDISGGSDRPYISDDPGIYVSAIKENGLADKSGQLHVDDRILKVNGKSVSCVTHDKAVQYFIEDRKKVTLHIHKHAGHVLRCASLTPTPPASGSISPSSDRQRNGRNGANNELDNSLSVSGFMLGLALGCATVVLLKRYLFSSTKT